MGVSVEMSEGTDIVETSDFLLQQLLVVMVLSLFSLRVIEETIYWVGLSL